MATETVLTTELDEANVAEATGLFDGRTGRTSCRRSYERQIFGFAAGCEAR